MELTKQISMGESEATIKGFKKEKSPGPDGWVIKFYSDFFDTLGGDLLKVLEHSRINGSLLESLTSTFIALRGKGKGGRGGLREGEERRRRETTKGG